MPPYLSGGGVKATGTCFEDAGRFVLEWDRKGLKGVVLVHGIVKNPADGFRIHHGWAETDDIVWEPQHEKVFLREEWYKHVEA